MIITNEQVQAALDYLINSPEEAAKAKAEFGYMKEYRKVVLAQAMHALSSSTGSMGERDQEARISVAYTDHLAAQETAEMHDAEHSFKRVAAIQVIEAWRTQEASNRGANKLQ